MPSPSGGSAGRMCTARRRVRVRRDVRASLDADPAARARWEALTASAKFQHLLRLHDTKRPETRARRIAEIQSGT